MIHRRQLVALLAATGFSCSPSAWSQADWPTKPIKIVVPVAAGGGTDFTARVLAEKLSTALGQPVIVDNRPGASGNLGVQHVANAPADGYTLVMPITSFPINPSLQKLPFDTVRDFAPVVMVGTLPLVLVVHPGLAAKNVQELIALGTSKKPLSYANSGTGTTAHLAGELFNRMAGIQMTSINYKGGGPAVNDLLGGHVQLYFSTIPSVSQHIESGKLRALAVTGKARSPELPNVPTVAESGLPGFDVTAWFGVFAPARTPKPVIDRLNAELVKILAMADVRQKLANHGVQPGGGTPESLRDFLVSDIDKWGKVVRDAGIRAE
ncbi:tripartite tricarboxylate transporter substrate binding protein [Ramlibacter sp. WS9]|uniref:Bug family tripartite tricarboxylate transporter substrate binding protein n=1 Tax=Ramlibacter sp. WS9 TaxID=1882741 RepID=UPI0011449C55|nr:tripartite tricarboxylate transporter substrate binding protein [Ramlibacter sp. WS9]ROZ68791.1 tripartite tricarboxylate transporter substrate binding protein [Ramlibacter sp. WS9]